MYDFDTYEETTGEKHFLETKSFNEMGVDNIKDIDSHDLLVYLRDMFKNVDMDLKNSKDSGEKCFANSYGIAAVYLNMAVSVLFDSTSFIIKK